MKEFDCPHPNRLAQEQSPYLLQHACNPVDWYPWGKEAFERARKEDKPIFLSIGYSTCHWCHVMERESFEDSTVAALMNDAFVSIKVDREERPDIDNIYMAVALSMNGHGGWPLTILMTPDQKPFFADTYLPRESHPNRVGMLDLMPLIDSLWTNDRAKLTGLSERVAALLKASVSASSAGDVLGESTLTQTYTQLAGSFDAVRGGFGQAPKFPTPHHLLFLLRYAHRTNDTQSLNIVETTLQAMRRGGIYDHVGFGFHRYSTDANWLLPHFEKMLYDQAMLTMAYTEAYQATKKPAYAQTTREILTYVLRDMTDEAGGFYSAEDADSEDEEGKFYLWSIAELRDLLSAEEAGLMIATYNMKDEGNFLEQTTRERTGTNILHLTQSLEEVAGAQNTSVTELENRLETIRQKLFEVRETRIHPYKDDKVLTDWNGLMIAALSKAARVLDEPEYAKAAQRAADFLLKTMRNDKGRLLHRYRSGHAAHQANVDDYAFLIWGLLELYETTFEVRYLAEAINLQDQQITHFWDETQGGFFFTPADGENLLIRSKELYDGAIPSGNSVAYLNLLRIGHITAKPAYTEKAVALNQAFSQTVGSRPMGYTQFDCAIDFAVGPAYEVVIAGQPDAPDTKAMLKALHQTYVPNKVVLFRPIEERPAIATIAPFTEQQHWQNQQATAYVCQNYFCELPTNDVEQMLTLLNRKTK